MIDIESYIQQLITALIKRFPDKLSYVGLQGSYLRGEATDDSDIDIMVVIKDLSTDDLTQYRQVIESLPGFDRSCGFICSNADLANWNPLEICSLLHSTKDYYGQLDKMVPAYTRNDIRNFVKISLNNLYHEICHRYVHATLHHNEAALPRAFKGVFFILQNLHYLDSNEYVTTKSELLSCLSGKDYNILSHAIAITSGEQYNFTDSFNLLFTWCQDTLAKL